MNNPIPPPPPPPTTLLLQQQPSETLAKDCKEFYERRLRLTHSVEHKWSSEEASLPSLSPFSKLPNQIAQLRSELLSLAHLDNELFRNLLALNDKLEELKLHRDQACSSTTTSNEGDMEEAVMKTETTEEEEEYDDDDIDEEVEDDDNPEDDAFSAVYSSLPPTQILERAAAAAAAAAADRINPNTSADENQSPSVENNASSGLDVMGGLKFMLRSRSFLLRPPFHKKNTAVSAAAVSPVAPVQSRTTPRRSRITSSDSPFR